MTKHKSNLLLTRNETQTLASFVQGLNTHKYTEYPEGTCRQAGQTPMSIYLSKSNKWPLNSSLPNPSVCVCFDNNSSF